MRKEVNLEIWKNLFKGKENAIPSKKLCTMLRCNRRDLTSSIAIERKSGIPICASKEMKKPGYYLAKDKNEMNEYCQAIAGIIKELESVYASCVVTASKMI